MKDSLAAILLIAIAIPPLLVALTTPSLASQPTGSDNSGPNDDSTWEVGALWVNNYQNSCCDNCGSQQVQNLECRDDAANSLINVLSSNGFINRFNLGDCNALEQQLVDESLGGLDYCCNGNYYADGVDLLLVTGHGGPYAFQFCVGCYIVPSEIRLGDRDLEWIIFDSPGIMETIEENTPSTPWNQIFHGLHAMLGFSTGVPDKDLNCFLGTCLPVCGKREELFANYLVSGYSVVEAWRRATIESIRDPSVRAGGYGAWDPVTQSYGIYDAPYANPPVMSSDAASPQYFMGMFWSCG